MLPKQFELRGPSGKRGGAVCKHLLDLYSDAVGMYPPEGALRQSFMYCFCPEVVEGGAITLWCSVLSLRNVLLL